MSEKYYGIYIAYTAVTVEYRYVYVIIIILIYNIIIHNCDYVEFNHKMKHTLFLPSAFSTQC